MDNELKSLVNLWRKYVDALNRYEDLDEICQEDPTLASQLKQEALKHNFLVLEYPARGISFFHIELSVSNLSKAKELDLISKEELELATEAIQDARICDPREYFKIWGIE